MDHLCSPARWEQVPAVSRISGLLARAWNSICAHAKWTKDVLSERDGSGSASRVCLFVVTVTVCGCLIANTIFTRKLPGEGSLLGLSALLTAGAGGYGVNRISHRGDSEN